MTSIYGGGTAPKRNFRHTRRVPEASDYVARAASRIVEVLNDQHAVVAPELQARIAEAGYRRSGMNVDPHHITTALNHLFAEGTLASEVARTRGGREVVTIRLRNVRRRETRIQKATGRKRVLMARYQGWSQGTKRHPHGTIGPAGETALRSAIVASGALQPAAAGAGEVTHLLGTPLPGPADSAGFMVPIVRSMPQAPVTVLFEVKNLRSWIYPSSAELYQLLHKAVVLQRAHPDQQVVGMLACRRAHKTTYWMAHQLGFVVIEMDTQFAGPVDINELNEVRNELHFNDLRTGTGPSLRVRDRLSASAIPHIIPTIAGKWKATALHDPIADTIVAARKATTTKNRLNLVDHLRSFAKAEGHRGGW